jgi:ubiquinone/menaquinone biosynthesis C-methylase UbiE
MSKLSRSQLLDIVQWDVKTWSRTLKFWEKHLDFHTGLSVLAIGEREGGLSLWLAKKGLKVNCTDYNAFPESTQKMHLENNVQELISYDQGVDVTDLSRYKEGQFDIVVFKSVIGVLSEKERQKQALDEMRRVLKPGGTLIFAENLLGTRLHVLLRKKFIRWNSYWRYLNLKDDQDLFMDFSVKKFKTTGFTANFGRSEKQRSFLATMDAAVLWVIPKRWRYVLFGVLVK